MAGLDKMKSQILNEAKAAADAKTAKANAEAEVILSDANPAGILLRSADEKKISPSCASAYLPSSLRIMSKYSLSLMLREMNCQIRFIVCYFRRRR